MVDKDTVSLLRASSWARVDSSPDFEKLRKRIEWERNKREQLLVMLNEEKYRAFERENTPPQLPETRPGEPDYYLKEVLAVSADYRGFLGDKTATPPAVAAKKTEDSPEVVIQRRRKAELDAAALDVAILEKKRKDSDNVILLASGYLALAKAAYRRAKPGTIDEALAGLVVAAAERGLSEANADKDGVESKLKAARDRLNRLNNEK